MNTSRRTRIASVLSGLALVGLLVGGAASAASAGQPPKDVPLQAEWEGGIFEGSGSFPLGNGNTPPATANGEVPAPLKGEFKSEGLHNGVYVYTPYDRASTQITQGTVDAFNAAKNAGQSVCSASSDNSSVVCPN